MPIGIRLLFAVICTAGWVLAQAAPVPFTDLARQYQYRDVKISPDGQHIAAVAVIKGESVLALVDLATGQGAAVHPRDGDQVVDFWWVNPNRVLYTVGLKWGGDEHGRARPRHPQCRGARDRPGSAHRAIDPGVAAGSRRRRACLTTAFS